MLAASAKRQGLKLFRLRPKIHLSQHQVIALLDGRDLALNTLCFLLASHESFCNGTMHQEHPWEGFEILTRLRMLAG